MTFQTVFKTDKEFEEFKTWVLGVLHDDHIKDLRITFVKINGTERIMQCTLVQSRIPSDKHPKTTTPSTASNGPALRVFDTEKSEWRSFRWDAVIKVEFAL